MYAVIARYYERYLKLSAARPGLVLLVILVSSGLLLWAGSNIKIRGDLEDLFPDGTPAVARAREAQKVLGATQELRVLVGSPEREVNRKVATEIGAFLAARDDIARVEVRRDISFFETNGLLFMPLADLQKMQEKVSEAIQKAVKKNLDLDDGFELDEPEEKPKAEPEKKDALTLPSIEEIKRDYKIEGFNEYFESPDGQVVAVKAYPKFKAADSSKTSALNDALDAWQAEALKRYPNVSFTADGDYSQVTRAAKQITGDAATSGIASLVLIAVLMFLFFRRVRVVLVAVVVLLVTFAYTMGFAFVGIGYLNLITSISFTILFGMSVDYIVHGVARVDEEYQGGRSLEDAMRIGLFGLARPVFNAMLTTAVTFWALIFFDFRGFSQLGVIAGFGVVFALIAFYAVYPPLAFWMHRVWKQKPKRLAADHVPHSDEPEPELGLKAAPPVKAWQKKAAWGILATVAVLTALSLVVMQLTPSPKANIFVEPTASGPEFTLVKWNNQLPERTRSYTAMWDALDKSTPKFFDPNTGRFKAQTAASEDQLKSKYKQAESRGISPALVITKDLAETERLQRFLQAHQHEYPALTEVRSIYTFVPPEQDAKLEIIKETKRKLDNKYGALEGQAKADADRLMPYLTPTAFTVADLPDWVKVMFTDAQGNLGRYVLLYTKGSKSNALDVQKVRDQLGELSLPADGDLPAATLVSSASYYVSAEAYLVVKREGPLAAIIGLVVVLLVVLTEFRRPKELAMITVPILASFAIMLGVMWLVDLPLDLFNVIVLPQVFGIGIDTGTHLTHRIKEGGPRVVQNVRHTAYAAGLSSLLTSVGFAALLFTSNVGLQGIGWLAVLGIGTAYAVNIAMFTAFLWIGRPLEGRA